MAPKFNSIPVITIDGLTASGKGTIAQKLAQQLHFHWLDSGILYRLIALISLRRQITSDDHTALAQLAQTFSYRIEVQNEPYSMHANIAQKIFLDQEDVTQALRTPKVSQKASEIATHHTIRNALIDKQRAFCQPPGLVADGRDMGTVIFPQAQLKIFLTADLTIRAQRRQQELKQKGIEVDLKTVMQTLATRDQRDQTRNHAPLKPAADAYLLDTSNLSIEQIFLYIKQQWQQQSVEKQ